MDLTMGNLKDLVEEGVRKGIYDLFGLYPMERMKTLTRLFATTLGDMLKPALVQALRDSAPSPYNTCMPYKRGDTVEVVPRTKGNGATGARGTLISFSQYHIEVQVPTTGSIPDLRETIPMDNVAKVIIVQVEE